MKINPVSTNIYSHHILNGIKNNSKNQKQQTQSDYNAVCYPPVYFLGKYRAKTKPENVIKSVNSAVKYDNKDKAAKILSDFYTYGGGYEEIVKNPNLRFQEFKDNVTNKKYTHKFNYKDYQELFIKKDSIAYRNKEKIYAVQIEKNKKPEIEEFTNKSILFYDLTQKVYNQLQSEGAQKSAQTLQNFWIEYGGFQNIKEMMGKKAKPVKTSQENEKYYLRTKSAFFTISEDEIGIQCTKKNKQTNGYSKITVRIDENNNIKNYRAKNYTEMGIGIYDSICYY